MPPLPKLIFALLALIGVLILVCGVFLDQLLGQTLVFIGLVSLLLFLRGGRRFLGGLKLILPFLVSLCLIYVIFGWLRVKTPDGEPGSLLFWTRFGLQRILLFINTVLAFQAFFSCVGFSDLLRLPLGIGILKYVILGKALHEAALGSYGLICRQLRFIPSEQQVRNLRPSRFKSRLASLLALLLALVNEARSKGQQIDNRIATCHGKPVRGSGDWYLVLGFTVMVTVATMIVPIPVPGGGFFNFGDVMVVFVGLYAGKRAGALAGGIGSAIADLLLFPLFAPITLLVKGTEGFLCGLAFKRNGIMRTVFSLLGAGVIVLGYFLGEWFMPQLGKAVAVADLPVNIIQAVAGFLGGRALFEAARHFDL